MKVIKPNCRIQFTAEDVDFVLRVLGGKVQDIDCLVKLLADEDTRDLVLDDEALFHALLESRGCLRVSTHFYFYILVRQVFQRSGLTDRRVADYVAAMLSELVRAEQGKCQVPGREQPLEYFFEMLAALQTADDQTSFQMRVHVGNYSLFLSGVFPERIRTRAERRGFPDLKYYETLGRTQFRVASDHRLAQRYELADILNTLSERFETSRQALNDMSERLLVMTGADYSLEKLLSVQKSDLESDSA